MLEFVANTYAEEDVQDLRNRRDDYGDGKEDDGDFIVAQGTCPQLFDKDPNFSHELHKFWHPPALVDDDNQRYSCYQGAD